MVIILQKLAEIETLVFCFNFWHFTLPMNMEKRSRLARRLGQLDSHSRANFLSTERSLWH